MNKLHRLSFLILSLGIGTTAFAQYEDSGISAGFFDASESSTINFSTFHLPPLAVLYENAKQHPMILSLEKAQEIAQAEVAKQKRHIFSYVYGHASYSYGKTDIANVSDQPGVIRQYTGSEQAYWNVGVNLSVPLEDILDLSASVKRKRLEVDAARLEKEIKFEDLKQQIGHLYVRITNTLVTLKTSGESSAIYQGAGALNQEDFHQGNMDIEDFAYTKLHELDVVKQYQLLQTEIMTDLITLEILSRTPIITNATTEVTLDGRVEKSDKQIRRENKAVEKRLEQETKATEKRYQRLERADHAAQVKARREAEREASRSAKAARKYDQRRR